MNTTDQTVTVVIPTAAEESPLTLESIPDDVDVRVEREGTLNEARNRGVKQADTELVIVMDDDLRFPERSFRRLVTRARENPEHLVGVADWNYGWVAGRVMAFHRDLWRDAGGFDERLRSHMGDTKFALDAMAAGYDLERVPREVFYHEPHERSISAWDHAWRGLYLAARYPTRTPHLFKGMVFNG